MEFDQVNLDVKKKQGNVGVARAIYEYTRMGYTVLLPFTDSDKYDLVIDNGSRLLKVQVKTTRMKSKSGNYNRSGYTVQIKTTGGNRKINTIHHRKKEDYDILFVLTELGECWSIPSHALGNTKNCICVGANGKGAKYSEYKISLREIQ